MSIKPKATIIVVDDDASIRRALDNQLRVMGFEVLIFKSARELLASTWPTANACLLADVYMPEISGIELCRRLAAAGRYLPTVLMTGCESPETEKLIRQSDAVAHLFKPFDESKLLRVLRKALSQYSKRSR